LGGNSRTKTVNKQEKRPTPIVQFGKAPTKIPKWKRKKRKKKHNQKTTQSMMLLGQERKIKSKRQCRTVCGSTKLRTEHELVQGRNRPGKDKLAILEPRSTKQKTKQYVTGVGTGSLRTRKN